MIWPWLFQMLVQSFHPREPATFYNDHVMVESEYLVCVLSLVSFFTSRNHETWVRMRWPMWWKTHKNLPLAQYHFFFSNSLSVLYTKFHKFSTERPCLHVWCYHTDNFQHITVIPSIKSHIGIAFVKLYVISKVYEEFVKTVSWSVFLGFLIK